MGEYEENASPVNELLSSIEEAALDSDPAADSGPRKDASWLRWLKYLSIIVFPAILLGLGFLFENYMEQYRAQTVYQRDFATRQVEHDSMDAMKYRFWIGAALGGGLGLVYVTRCIVRRVDP